MNFDGSLDALATFAHESGHALHTILSYEKQPFTTADCSVAVAEVASTLNEQLLLDAMLASATGPAERCVLLQQAAELFLRTFYTQALWADFERQAHHLVEEGRPVSVDVLNVIYGQLLQAYYGDSLTIDELDHYRWTQAPHLFSAPFYVFQYATSLASSLQLRRALTTGSDASRAMASERCLALLQSGGDNHPMEQLKLAGIDLTRNAAVQSAIRQMDEWVTQIETEVAKLARTDRR